MQINDANVTPAAPPAAPGKSAATAAGRAAYLAASAARKAEAPPADPPAAKAPPPDAEEIGDPSAEVEAPSEEGEAEVTPPAPKADDLDPAVAKRLAAKQEAERDRKLTSKLEAERKAWKEQQDAAERKLAEREAEIARRAAALDTFEKLKARAKYEPDAVLAELGLSDEDFEHAARAAWARSPAAKADPKNRDAVVKSAREKERDDRLTAAEKRAEAAEKAAAEARKMIEERESAVKAEAAIGEYLNSIVEVAKSGKAMTVDEEGNEVEAATVDTPILKRWLASDGKEARRRMHEVAVEMAERDGAVPDPWEVAAEVEKRERLTLKKRGFDPAAFGQAAAPAPAAKKPTAPPPKTLGQTGAAPSQPPRKLTAEEQRAEFIRRRATGKFED